jgi:hypothetical protein
MQMLKNTLLTVATFLACCFPVFAQSEPNLETLTEVVTSPTTFAICKAVDVGSTVYLLSHGLGVEANPVVAASMQIGGYVPLIAFSVGLYYLIKYANRPEVTGLANVVTCGVAAHNLLLIR